MAENDDSSVASDDDDVESSFFYENRKILEMDRRLETVTFVDKVGVDYGSDASM